MQFKLHPFVKAVELEEAPSEAFHIDTPRGLRGDAEAVSRTYFGGDERYEGVLERAMGGKGRR